MADEKQSDAPIELIAVERGFVMGRMVEPGTKFMFSPVDRNGKPRKLPKWAKKPGDAQAALAAKAAKLKAFDTKPKDVSDAAKRKLEQLLG